MLTSILKSLCSPPGAAAAALPIPVRQAIAAAPPTISEISLVIAAWRVLL
jgi:hypothetical protein